jgi:hypothetical protein
MVYYQNFGFVLKREPSKKLEAKGLIESVQNKNKVIELVKEIMGKDFYKDQIKYLVDTLHTNQPISQCKQIKRQHRREENRERKWHKHVSTQESLSCM